MTPAMMKDLLNGSREKTFAAFRVEGATKKEQTPGMARVQMSRLPIVGAALGLFLLSTVFFSSRHSTLTDSPPPKSDDLGKESPDGHDYSLQFQKELRAKIIGRFSKLKECVAKKAEEQLEDTSKFWKELSDTINKCTATNSVIKEKEFMSFHMGRFGEKKHFLQTKKNWKPDSHCKFLTIGIGGDTKVEKEFHGKFKQCEIFGIEAAPDQHSDFHTIGTVIPYAIGMEPGKLSMRIRNAKGLYDAKEVEIVPMPEAIAKYTPAKVFYFMTIDLESFEYDILTNLQDGKAFADSGLVFCQIDAEIHTPSFKRDKTFKPQQWLADFLRESPYVAVHATDFEYHRKITFIRADGHQVCENVFQFSNYF